LGLTIVSLIIVTSIKRKGVLTRLAYGPLAKLQTPFYATGWFAVVIGVVHFGNELTPSGHDPIHHLSWARNIFQSGYVPYQAAFSQFMDIYPRGFPSLVCIWIALSGLSGFYLAPFLHCQPFLQLALSVLAGAGFFVDRKESRLSVSAVYSVFAIFLIFSWLPAVAPNPYIEGIGRYSSVGVVSLLFLLGVYARSIGQDENVRFWLGLILIPIAALSLLINPAVFVQYLCVVPLLVVGVQLPWP
jgi:hypothetical protein